MIELINGATRDLDGISTRRWPANKGRRYPADPPRVEEIVAVLNRQVTATMSSPAWIDHRALVCRPFGFPKRWLSPSRTWRWGGDRCLCVATRAGVVERVDLDDWTWDQLRPWLATRISLPAGSA